MPAAVACPECQKIIALDWHDPGGRVICPACGASFSAIVSERLAAEATLVAPPREIPISPPPPVRPAPVASRAARASLVWSFLAGVATCAIAVLVIRALQARPRTAVNQAVAVARVEPPAPRSSPLPSTIAAQPTPATPGNDDELPAPGKLFDMNATPSPAPAAQPQVHPIAAATQPITIAVVTQPAAPPIQVASAATLEIKTESPAPATLPAQASAQTEPSPPTAVDPNAPAPSPVVVQYRPALKPAPPLNDQVLDQRIGQAIERGVHNLLAQFSGSTYMLNDMNEEVRLNVDYGRGDTGLVCGRNALAVYALMQAGLTINDPRLRPEAPMMRGLIERMKSLPATNGKVTYARGIRATALALFNRPEDRAALVADVHYLVQTERNGAYTYIAVPAGSQAWDNSNSQYGLLGVWSGAEAGVEVPQEYWVKVEDHWKGSQFSDGRWCYNDSTERQPSITMTAAGIASLFVTRQWLEFPKFRGDVGLDPFSPSLRSALQWWETGNNYLDIGGMMNQSRDFGYAIYGIERVGLASGFKFFGRHEWYREMAANLIAVQERDGSWGNVVNTSYIMIFLARGRHPVLMNKLRFDHTPGMNNRYWDNRPQDMNHLATWASHEMERPVNWQIVNLDRDYPDWMDAPVLYLASHRPLKFTEADYAKMRHFAEAGGMIFTQADGDSESFDRFAAEFARKLFPNYEFQDVPPSHPIYSMNYDLHGQLPLKMVSNGSRILLLHSPKDISQYWELRDDKLHKKEFQLGLNIFLYANGKQDLRNKLITPYVPEPPPLPKEAMHIKVVRLMYNGNWDPEPGSWDRYRRVFQNATGSGIDLDTLQIKDLRSGLAPLAHLTGTAAYEFTPDEAAALRNFVREGGVVLIDACGGSGAFAESMRKGISAAFGGKSLSRIPYDHPLLSLGNAGMADLSKPQFRPYVIDKMGPRFAGGFEMLSSGRGHVIFSPLDLSSGMLGTNTWGIWGYKPEYCQSFLQNLIFWTVDGQDDPTREKASPPGSTLDASPPAVPTQPATTRPSANLDRVESASPTTEPAGKPAVATTAPEMPSRPVPRPAPPSESAVLDAQVLDAIKHAQEYVIHNFTTEHYWPRDFYRRHIPFREIDDPQKDNGYRCGLEALSVYALMQAGLATHDPRLSPSDPFMDRLIDEMKLLPANNGHAVYARGIRAAALALFNRREDRPALQVDVSYLLRVVHDGSYSYPVPRYADNFDNSNSQYGLLGVWSGAEVGIEVPQEYWASVENHWKNTQLPDGRWPYQHTIPTLTMTAAGIASMFITREWLEMPTFHGDVGLDPFSPQLRKALDWWEVGDNWQNGDLKTNQTPGHFGYAVYGTERVGLASGFKFFGIHEWYREMAKAMLKLQCRDGTWRDGQWSVTMNSHNSVELENDQNLSDLIDTCYILIFLARGRHPVLMNKLRTDHTEALNNRYWDNRPMDMHNLASWSSHELERPLNWQIVNLERDYPDWMDAPVLYIASHRPLKFTEADYAKIRQYVEAGGMIFTQADGDSSLFNDFVVDFAKKLFPKYELQDVPASHPIYSVDYDLGGNPSLKMVTNGSRVLLLHSTKDISRYWETRDDKLHKRLFQLGLNISLYAGGKKLAESKLLTPYVPEPPPLPKDAMHIKILRLMYNGNWDPEPGSWERYRRVFQNATGSALDLDTLQLKDLRPGLAPLVHLTGTAAYEFTPDEATALRNFVQQGGVVLIDACGGSGAFTESMRKSIPAAFEGKSLSRIPPSHPMLSLGNPGMADLSKPQFRPYVIDRMGPTFAGGLEMLSFGRGHVIFSPLDLSSGMLGTNTWGIWGYKPEYCQSFLQNLIFWTLDGQADPLPAAQDKPK